MVLSALLKKTPRAVTKNRQILSYFCLYVNTRCHVQKINIPLCPCKFSLKRPQLASWWNRCPLNLRPLKMQTKRRCLLGLAGASFLCLLLLLLPRFPHRSSPSMSTSVGERDRSSQHHNMTRIEVFGERRSGTNWLQSMLETNFGPKVLAVRQRSTRRGYITRGPHGWKHGPVSAALIANSLATHDPTLRTAETLFLVLVKNPYAWLLSMQANPHHALLHVGLPLSAFLRRPWRSFQNGWTVLARLGLGNPELEEDKTADGASYANVCALRTGKLRAHLELLTTVQHAALIRYEDMLFSPGWFLSELAAQYNLHWLHGQFVPVEQTCDPHSYRSGRCLGVRESAGRRARYGSADGPWTKHFSNDDLGFIAQELDVSLERALGYDLLLPPLHSPFASSLPPNHSIAAAASSSGSVSPPLAAHDADLSRTAAGAAVGAARTADEDNARPTKAQRPRVSNEMPDAVQRSRLFHNLIRDSGDEFEECCWLGGDPYGELKSLTYDLKPCVRDLHSKIKNHVPEIFILKSRFKNLKVQIIYLDTKI
eukprot:g26979.t1